MNGVKKESSKEKEGKKISSEGKYGIKLQCACF